ncbi:hypothetical protein [Desulfocurvus sp. DL9XJH121]
MHFETSFGDRIPILPGYRGLFPHREDSLRAASSLAAHIAEGGGQAVEDHYQPISLMGYAVRLGRVSRMIQFMNEAGIAGKYHSMLDLGTGHGVQPMLLKGFGLAEQARGIDIVKREGSAPRGHLKKRHLQLRLIGPVLDWLYRKAQSDPNAPFGADFNKAVLKFGSPRLGDRQYTGSVLASEYFYKLRLKSDTQLDEYIGGDIYEHNASYDLITAFSALMLFPTEKVVAKISDLLEEGGILCVLDPVWWYGSNSFPFVGDFPWAGQRLTPEDYLRYIEQFYPSELERYAMAQKYFTFPQPTLRAYEEIGARYGLRLIAYKRFIPSGWSYKRGPSATLQANWAEVDVDEILHNISRFRDDVCRDDLFTSFMAFAFRKCSSPANAPVGDPDANPFLKRYDGKQSPLFRLVKKTVLKVTTNN